MPEFGFVGGSAEDVSANFDGQRTMNLFVEMSESGNAKSKAKLTGTPGLVKFGGVFPAGAFPASPIRGICAAGSTLNGAPRLFVVAGQYLFEVSSTGAIIPAPGNFFGNGARGVVGDDAQHSPAYMFPNGNQLLVVSAGRVYCDNGAGTVPATYLTGSGHINTDGTAVTWVDGDQFSATLVGQSLRITGLDYPVVSVQDAMHLTLGTDASLRHGDEYTTSLPVMGVTAAFLDGYFIVQVPNSKQFNLSALNDGTSWDGLDFGVKESDPYNIGRILRDHEDLWIFGEEQSEIWRNTGGANFPLQRQYTIAQGIAAPHSAVSIANAVAWIGSDSRGGPVAWMASGYQPVRISTHAEEQAWQSYATVADAVGYAYEDGGHQFWMLSFPTANATWCYDVASSSWHERGGWTGSAYKRHLSNAHAYQFGAHIVGDYAAAQLYKMSLAYYDDAGSPIQRERVSPHISNENRWVEIPTLTLDVETGLGAAPAVTLEISRDGGRTFGAVHNGTLGALGNTLARVIWRRLGRARDWVFRVRTAATSRLSFVNAYIQTGKVLGT